MGHVKVLLGMFLSLKTLYRKRTVIWPFYFYTIIRTLSKDFKVQCVYNMYLIVLLRKNIAQHTLLINKALRQFLALEIILELLF
ncbi:hypothetical protein EGX64_07295 [Staphylococcus epidermidis]|nr:hypothetical protein EGX64_07295 [Staphylococcus epidermidis]